MTALFQDQFQSAWTFHLSLQKCTMVKVILFAKCVPASNHETIKEWTMASQSALNTPLHYCGLKKRSLGSTAYKTNACQGLSAHKHLQARVGKTKSEHMPLHVLENDRMSVIRTDSNRNTNETISRLVPDKIHKKRLKNCALFKRTESQLTYFTCQDFVLTLIEGTFTKYFPS